MNAAEAARLTLEHAEKQVERVNTLIRDACINGYCELFLEEKNWTPTIRLFLKNNNYQTSVNPITNGQKKKYLVSWEHVIKK